MGLESNNALRGMIGYQIAVTGSYTCFSNEFKAYSKTIYLHKPTQEEIDAFLKRCSTSESGFFDLDLKKPYEYKIVEMEIIE